MIRPQWTSTGNCAALPDQKTRSEIAQDKCCCSSSLFLKATNMINIAKSEPQPFAFPLIMWTFAWALEHTIYSFTKNGRPVLRQSISDLIIIFCKQTFLLELRLIRIRLYFIALLRSVVWGSKGICTIHIVPRVYFINSWCYRVASSGKKKSNGLS